MIAATRGRRTRPIVRRLGLLAALCAPIAQLWAAAFTVTDDAGREVRLARAPPLRIVSLAPGATETLFAAGAGDDVVATVEYSVAPPAAKRIPRIGDVTGIDLERLIALHPDVVIVWPGGFNPAQLAKLPALGIPLYRQQVDALDDLPGSVRRLGALAGTRTRAEAAARAIAAHIAQLRTRYANPHPPSVLLEVWNRPLYTVGARQLMSDVLRVCGTRNAFADLSVMAPTLDLEAVIARDPDVIVAAAFRGDGAEWLEEWRRFPQLRAVREHRLLSFEDPRLSRLGPSVLDAADGLCRALARVRAPERASAAPPPGN